MQEPVDSPDADLVVFYTRPGPYTYACLNALADKADWRILLVRYERGADVPNFEPKLKRGIKCLSREGLGDERGLAKLVREAGARVVLMAGWSDKAYLRAARRLRAEGVFVIAGCDNQYRGSLRQKAAGWLARWYLHPAIDVLWTTGGRARQFAGYLGYRGPRCWSGFYCCDVERYTAVQPERAACPRFLFAGRYVLRKGLDILLDAYRAYRESVDEPWDLWCAGAGPLGGMLENEPGVRDLGFLDPPELAQVAGQAACLVLPSRFEAWGVVVQEAVAAGLPVICSDEVGAGDHLVRPGVNGWTFRSESTPELVRVMRRVSRLPEKRRRAMGEAGRRLARAYHPRIWAETIVDGVACWKTRPSA